MLIICLCLDSSLLRLQKQSELGLRDSPQFSYIRSLHLTVLHLHSEILGALGVLILPAGSPIKIQLDNFGVSSLLYFQISITRYKNSPVLMKVERIPEYAPKCNQFFSDPCHIFSPSFMVMSRSFLLLHRQTQIKFVRHKIQSA